MQTTKKQRKFSRSTEKTTLIRRLTDSFYKLANSNGLYSQIYTVRECFVSILSSLFSTPSDLPECIQGARHSEHRGTITLLTTNPKDTEFLAFITKYGAQFHLTFEIQTCQAYTPLNPTTLSDNDHTNKYKITSEITSSSPLFVLQHSLQERADLPANFDEFLALINQGVYAFRTRVWTLGGLLQDDVTGRLYIASAAHCVFAYCYEDLKQEYSLSMPKLAFYTSVQKTDENTGVTENRMTKIGEKYRGFFGTHHEVAITASAEGGMTSQHSIVGSSAKAVDSLLVEIDEGMTQQVQEVYFEDEHAQPITIDIYADDLRLAAGVDVWITGSVSGRRHGRIIDARMQELRMCHELCSGFFAVASRDASGVTRQRFAQQGDSGSYVIGKHPSENRCVVYGLVYAHQDKHYVEDARCEKPREYHNITYCTSFKTVADYWLTHSLELKPFISASVQNFSKPATLRQKARNNSADDRPARKLKTKRNSAGRHSDAELCDGGALSFKAIRDSDVDSSTDL